MSSSDKNPKPPSAPRETDSEDVKEEEKNVDRDGRERQPTQHTNDKT
jgi:hypothetical protein